MKALRMTVILMRVAAVPLCLGFVLALAVASLTHMYTVRAQLETAQEEVDIAKRIQTNGASAARIVVQSYDPGTKILTAFVQGATITLPVPTRLQIAEDARIERRDLIFENGVVIGSKPLAPATTDELVPGTHGLASVHIGADGKSFVRYVLIGNPFPVP